MLRWIGPLVFFLFSAAVASAALERRTWTVLGAPREALVSIPETAAAAPTPVVFVFHGHGGTMQNAARTISIHAVWPEAIVFYPQGLPTPGQLTDKEGKRSGWQARAGDQGDRDLALVDTLLAAAKAEFRVDPKRVFATGHSNGGGFTYLLWAERPDEFSAFAPSSSVLGQEKKRPTTPKPILHIAGRTDPLVKFAWQERAMAAVRKIDRCDETGVPWAPGGPLATLYPSAVGSPVVTLIYPGGHTFYTEAPAVIVKFFKTYGGKE